MRPLGSLNNNFRYLEQFRNLVHLPYHFVVSNLTVSWFYCFLIWNWNLKNIVAQLSDDNLHVIIPINLLYCYAYLFINSIDKYCLALMFCNFIINILSKELYYYYLVFLARHEVKRSGRSIVVRFRAHCAVCSSYEI